MNYFLLLVKTPKIHFSPPLAPSPCPTKAFWYNTRGESDHKSIQKNGRLEKHSQIWKAFANLTPHSRVWKLIMTIIELPVQQRFDTNGLDTTTPPSFGWDFFGDKFSFPFYRRMFLKILLEYLSSLVTKFG